MQSLRFRLAVSVMALASACAASVLLEGWDRVSSVREFHEALDLMESFDARGPTGERSSTRTVRTTYFVPETGPVSRVTVECDAAFNGLAYQIVLVDWLLQTRMLPQESLVLGQKTLLKLIRRWHGANDGGDYERDTSVVECEVASESIHTCVVKLEYRKTTSTKGPWWRITMTLIETSHAKHDEAKASALRGCRE